MRLSTRITALITLVAALAIAATFVTTRFTGDLEGRAMLAITIAALCIVPVVLWASSSVVRQISQLHDDLGNALRSARDGDYTLRLRPRGDREMAELRTLYNELAAAVRGDRQSLHAREILLDTILQRSPQGVVLLNGAERVVYSNSTARRLFARGGRLDGRKLDEIVEYAEPSIREPLQERRDALLQLEEETFYLTQRSFQLHTQQHRLIVVEHLSPELRRQELLVWKKAIRIINHEINNSVAPISSLFHSARRAQERPEHRHRLEEIYGLIEERLAHLRQFLESYAEFARLPEPRKSNVSWAELLESVRSFYSFRTEGDADFSAAMDGAQMQQVLINLVKNAHESGGSSDNVVVTIQRTGSDAVLRVMDRGRGMSEEVMRQALVPFYTTKPEGSGLGLALCNEIVEAHGGRMRLAAREGGGTVVTCWLPLGQPLRTLA